MLMTKMEDNPGSNAFWEACSAFVKNYAHGCIDAWQVLDAMLPREQDAALKGTMITWVTVPGIPETVDSAVLFPLRIIDDKQNLLRPLERFLGLKPSVNATSAFSIDCTDVWEVCVALSSLYIAMAKGTEKPTDGVFELLEGVARQRHNIHIARVAASILSAASMYYVQSMVSHNEKGKTAEVLTLTTKYLHGPCPWNKPWDTQFRETCFSNRSFFACKKWMFAHWKTIITLRDDNAMDALVDLFLDLVRACPSEKELLLLRSWAMDQADAEQEPSPPLALLYVISEAEMRLSLWKARQRQKDVKR
jgi:hypothetical protein